MSKSRLPLGSMSQPARWQHDHPRLEFPHLPAEWGDKYKRGQMYKFNDKLMKLPVPPLQQTLQKYIASVEVIVYVCACVCVTTVQYDASLPPPPSLSASTDRGGAGRDQETSGGVWSAWWCGRVATQEATRESCIQGELGTSSDPSLHDSIHVLYAQISECVTTCISLSSCLSGGCR